MRTFILSIMLTLVVPCGCNASSDPVIQITVTWPGASAEEIEEHLPTLLVVHPDFAHAVVEDGEAKIYFTTDDPKAIVDFFDQDELPEDMTINTPSRVENGLPGFPPERKDSQLHITLDSSALAARGIPTQTVIQAIEEFDFSSQEGESVSEEQLRELEALELTMEDGTTVLLKEVASVAMEPIKRPLIIEGHGRN